jgi:hypothetical protein
MKTYLNVLTILILSSILDDARAENYQNLLSCDNGAAVVDVDISERKNVQLVIREPAIVRFLYGKGIWDASHARRNCRSENNQLICDPPAEIIIRGINRTEQGHQQGVFSVNDFAIGDAGSGLGSRPTLRFFRDGHGLKVAGYGFIDSRCEGFISPSTGQCMGRVIPGYEFEIANWYFQNCERWQTTSP